ncbi:ABC1 kinase family protein [Spongiivirga citrea]|uniref:AarF/ABC1/UbiB kinase family protein n=1 Tax=Spongiivirga citrea TaxID=1481457 RepID=A0A6M0CVX6_9FLAO|nr:AarF/UbiB family protein [Spongiivirga citrea]NER17920.1 AarF/ABC1/UbiB kinase family protein [Spongiivirga citrea]
MKTIDKIPTSKIGRTTELVKTGIKVGGNYLKYYGNKVVKPSLDKEQLNQDNAEDIYNGLKNLKGSALKVAQMLSMEKNILPEAYVERFSLSQFSVPPLSAPLVRKTFKKYFGDYPENLYDTFATQSINAASIGQVHQAFKNGKKLAVKIQYPGVAQSISSDLAMVKPVAKKMFNIKGKESDKYFGEVEQKLLEETDYVLELRQSQQMAEDCSIIDNIKFPSYYPELSNHRILTMDWMNGEHLSEFCSKNEDQEAANKIGQTLWDYYMFQMHGLKAVNADPHPGNFLVNDTHELIAIDFGCIKQIPEDFYEPYFELSSPENINNKELFNKNMFKLEILRKEDTSAELAFFSEIFNEMISLFTSPFAHETFDFGDETFWNRIASLSDKFQNDAKLRKMDAGRGSKHFLYMNRTFFGLFNLLHDLKAEVQVNDFRKYLKNTPKAKVA